MAGSEFVEILVGVGSARVRDLFKRAKVMTQNPSYLDFSFRVVFTQLSPVPHFGYQCLTI